MVYYGHSYPQPFMLGAKPWYKTVKGILLIIFLSFILLIVLGFACLFFYYAWQIKYGDAGKLAEEFSQAKFSQSSILGNNETNVSAADMKKYLQPFNPVLGKSDASIIIFTFEDFECPYCRAAQPVFKQVREKYAPVVRLVFKEAPLVDIHANAAKAALAAACANEQNKFWQYHDQLFADQQLDSVGLLAAAAKVGLNTVKFQACLEANKYQTQVETDLQDAVELGVRGTPTYFVNGEKVEGSLSAAEWDKIILKYLQK